MEPVRRRTPRPAATTKSGKVGRPRNERDPQEKVSMHFWLPAYERDLLVDAATASGITTPEMMRRLIRANLSPQNQTNTAKDPDGNEGLP